MKVLLDCQEKSENPKILLSGKSENGQGKFREFDDEEIMATLIFAS